MVETASSRPSPPSFDTRPWGTLLSDRTKGVQRMGTWGPGIFSNDLASDIRGDWRELMEDGVTPEEATDRLLGEYASAVADPDDGPVFWFALAAIQQSSGRLIGRVRDEALAIIDKGGDGASYAESDGSFRGQRERALSDLAAKLRGPQRPPTPMKRPRPHPSPAAVGDVILIHGDKGDRDALFLVVRLTAGYPRGSIAPELVGLRWEGGQVPPAKDLEKVALLREWQTDSGVAVWMVQGPTRGPNAFAAVAKVVASGVRRSDVTEIVRQLAQPHRGGRSAIRYALTSWRGMSAIVSGYHRRMLDVPQPKRSLLDRLRLH